MQISISSGAQTRELVSRSHRHSHESPIFNPKITQLTARDYGLSRSGKKRSSVSALNMHGAKTTLLPQKEEEEEEEESPMVTVSQSDNILLSNSAEEESSDEDEQIKRRSELRSLSESSISGDSAVSKDAVVRPASEGEEDAVYKSRKQSLHSLENLSGELEKPFFFSFFYLFSQHITHRPSRRQFRLCFKHAQFLLIKWIAFWRPWEKILR